MAAELGRLLCGALVEKIHGPAPDVSVVTFFARKGKHRLLLRHGRRSPLLFLCVSPPPNPAKPAARIMRLRKYCIGRRLGPGVADFVSRRMAFPIGAGMSPDFSPMSRSAAPDPAAERLLSEDARQREHEGLWLLLDACAGPEVLRSLPQGFGDDPPWPHPSLADALCRRSPDGGRAADSWREYAVLTPALRESLAELDPMEGRALLADLESGGGELFVYADASGQPCACCAWPLPDALSARRGLRLLREEAYGHGETAPARESARRGLTDGGQFPVLAAIARVQEARFMAESGAAAAAEKKTRGRRERRKADRLMDRLDQEEKRLRALLELRKDACLLQGVLWRYPASARLATVCVPVDASGGEVRTITLNPLMSLRDNMARMFRNSARGARGLEHLRRRRGEMAALREEAERDAPAAAPAAGEEQRRRPRRGKDSDGMRHVARFVSADGFVLLRGKNAAGNQALLKLGRPADLWLHALGGPSAHLIIRRAHPAEEIPESTLAEAAVLVGERSWQRHAAKAHVMVALLRHVRAVKGAEPGSVTVDAVLRTLTVDLPDGAQEQ
jgi:hypothetical protein